jgi:hypothetical protein
MHKPRLQGKSHVIPEQLVWDAWLKVKEKGGAAGPDGVTIEQFEADVKDRLYVLWNRMSSGSYFPGPVRAVEIPKKGKKGGVRVLGIQCDRQGGPNGDRDGPGAGGGEVFPPTPTAGPAAPPTMRCRCAGSGVGGTTGSRP